MFKIALVAALALSAAAAPISFDGVLSVSEIEETKKAGGTNWALLMAGSNTFMNYRHQSDIYHSYQILKSHGLKDENIIVMHYDDIANSPQNPTPGKVINSPTGPNVYTGVPKDYTGDDVNAQNFIGALAGDKSAVSCSGSTSTCRVLESTAKDNVFVYFADHGGPGILGVPSPGPNRPYIAAADVVKSLNTLSKNKMFKQLTFYIEACESGSIFDQQLPANINVYGVTAANPNESSWGMYCPGQGGKFNPPANLPTCLGDLFSINFLQDMDKITAQETLEQEYQTVKTDTGPSTEQTGHPNIQGSHVMQYGDTSWTSETVDTFIGTATKSFNTEFADLKGDLGTLVNSRDAELVSYFAIWKQTGSDADLKALNDYINWRRNVDKTVDALVERLAGSKLSSHIKTHRATPVTKAPECQMGMIKAFEQTCFSLNGYGLKHAGAMANLCNEGFTVAEARTALNKICGKSNPVIAKATAVPAAKNGPHYEDPNSGACQSGELSVQIQGIAGSFCSPKCATPGGACPTDVPSGTTATPQCALETQGASQPTYCALLCSSGQACPSNATCKQVGNGPGICTYDS